MNNCPCGRLKSYAECCGLVHQHISNAETAEDLMRSRYTAFTMGLGDFLIESCHSETRRPETKDQLLEWAEGLEWLGLDVVRRKKGQAEDDEGMVEFKAHYKENRKIRVLHQRAKFLREYGHWTYHSMV